MSLGGLQIPKPLKGFDIFALRSHSAPPVPGDGDARINCTHPVKSNAAPSEDNVSFKVDDVLPTAQKVVLHLAGRTRSRPPSRGANAELTGQDGPISCPNAENATVTTTNETLKTMSTSAATSPQKQLGTTAPATPLHAPTPASSLEAILLDRKRRIQAYGSTPLQGTIGSTSGITTRARLPDPALSMALSSATSNIVVPTIPRPSSASGSKAKGTRFKSSRLGSTDLMRTTMEGSRDRFAEQNNMQD